MFFGWVPPEVVRDGVCCGTGSSRRAVSTLDFELRKVREVQNTSCAVRPEKHRPNTTATADSIPHNLWLMYFLLI